MYYVPMPEIDIFFNFMAKIVLCQINEVILSFEKLNFYHIFIKVGLSDELISNYHWRHWTYKMPIRYFLSSVWVRLSIFAQLSIIQYMGLCVFS